MTSMTVRYLDGDRFTIGVRDHVLTIDQPIPSGDADTGPSPTEPLPPPAPTPHPRALGDRGLRTRLATRPRHKHPCGPPASGRHLGRVSGRAARGYLALHGAQQPGQAARTHHRSRRRADRMSAEDHHGRFRLRVALAVGNSLRRAELVLRGWWQVGRLSVPAGDHPAGPRAPPRCGCDDVARRNREAPGRRIRYRPRHTATPAAPIASLDSPGG
jgi:hypothetical protein